MNKFLMSSADPNKLSMTVRAFLIALVPILMIVTGLTEADINSAIELIVQITFWGSSIWAAGQGLWGILRKIRLGRWTAAK